MDAILPSEIARLVLGYLQEQKCEEVAKMFLETSPHLQECKLVAQRGGRYSTKVGGLSLTDMLEKYCAANSIVQEKLNKVTDSEQLKNCNDITEQLRYLLEGSRGHRFVVNINVPTQNSPNGAFGTPNITTSSRKRQHSSSDRGKRVVKSLNNLMEKDAQTSAGLNCDTVEATPLESLPGHKPSAKQLRTDNHTNKFKSPSKSNSTRNIAKESGSNVFTSIGTQSDLDVIENTHKNQPSETVSSSNLVQTPSKCTASTSTGQPTSFCSTEAQTLFDEPLANLSLLTEEILHRSDLAEQIAENINKSIIPIQENVHENPEAFDNAVKSAVETSDKTLEGLFNEIFKVAGKDGFLDDDFNDRPNQEMNNDVYNENIESMDIDSNTRFVESQIVQQTKRPDVPLKQRLRSSSKSQLNPDEDDSNALLENQNEEAIRSIVANVMASKQSTSVETSPQQQAIVESTSPNNVQQPEPVVPDQTPSSTGNENVEPNKNANSKKQTKPRKNARKPKTPKPKSMVTEARAEEVKLQEKNIMTMPTLILCSENDMVHSAQSLHQMKLDGYVPIAPKPLPAPVVKVVPSTECPAEPAAPKLFLRTVHVPRHLVKPNQLEASVAANQLIMQLQASPQKSITTTTSCSGSPIVVPLVITDEKQQQRGGQQAAESITLYGEESNSEVKVPAPVNSLPIISLDESTCHLATGTGLSPFFKGNTDTEVTKQVNKDQPKTVNTKKSNEAQVVTETSDGKDQPKHQMQNKDKKENKNKVEMDKDKKADVAEKNNPKIIVTAPDEDEIFCTETMVPETVTEIIESIGKQESINATKQKSIPEVKENKVDDKMTSTNIECKVNKQSIATEKDKKIEEKKGSNVENQSIATKKDSKPEEKSAPINKDNKTEEIVAPVEKNTMSDQNLVLAKNDSKLEEKANAKKTTRTADVITKRTPKSLMKDRSKNNRLSLSTPRRRNSHVRALDFDEKTPEHSATAKKVPQSCTRPKSSVVQGLFQSPPFSGETPPVTIAEPIPEPKPVRTHVPVPPIATRSPAPKLQGNWNKVAGIGLILGDSESSPEKTQPSMNLSTVTEEQEPPKSWDSDLRKIVGDINEEDDKRPKSAKKNRRRNSIRGKSFEEVPQPKSAKKNVNKTPTPSVSQDHLKITPPSTNLKPKVNVSAKTSPEILAHIRNLQTPCKIESTAVPPTPRVMFATPGGACLIKVGSGKEISIKDCVNTPDFPPTPCIVLTPKIVEEEEHEKKPSPYYEPSEESTPKEIASSEKISVQQVTTTVTIQKKNVVELQESKTIEITKFGVIEENMARKEIKEVESTSEDNSKEIIEEESLGETNVSADTTNTDSDSDSDSDSNSSSSSSSSNSSSSNSSSCSSNASSPTKSINVLHHENSATESDADSPQKVSHEELAQVAESLTKKENSPPQVVVEMTSQIEQLTSTISAIITSEESISKPKPKIIDDQTVSLPLTLNEQPRVAKLNIRGGELEEKKQRMIANLKQAGNSKRPVAAKRVITVKKVQAKKKIIKQEVIKKAKPSPKKKTLEVHNEEIKPTKVVENEKENLKTKVDQVKRDLFTLGDEAEQRTTRSQSARKSIDENPPLPGVLECLELIPANKSADDLLDQTADGLSNSQTNHLEVSFVYDDSVPIKKRKRNYSSSELENEYAFNFSDEDEVRIMKVQPFEEIFKMAPKINKKKSPKKSPIKAKRKVAKGPLAASSPIKKAKLQTKKSSKRKASPVKEEKQIEKKVKTEEKSCLDPQALLKKINVDMFLKSVHVSK